MPAARRPRPSATSALVVALVLAFAVLASDHPVRAATGSPSGAAERASTGATGGPPGDAATGEHSGTLDDGVVWRAVVPERWNGTLLLYSHGYVPSYVPIPNPPRIAPDDATAQALLDAGYALAGSSYAGPGWVVGTAVDDQLATLDAAVAAIGAEPRRVLAVGTSMGGLVTGRLAERAGRVIDGALPTCGLMHGGVNLNNYQLDGAHAIDQLLAPAADIQLVGYAGIPDAQAATAALTAAVEQGQQTAQGRARVALAAALFHAPDWRPGTEEPARSDVEGRQQAQYAWLVEMLGFVVPSRVDIEAAAGGNASWNAGVDYRALLRRSADRHVVAALYRDAGLDLHADLARLTATADVTPDPAALRMLRRTSDLSGDLQMPVLSLHTTDDQLAPVQAEEEYAEQVREAGDDRLLRQAWVARPGHCTFTTAELVAGVEVLEQRVATGRWGAVTAGRLNRVAARLDLGDAAFVPYRPGEFLADRDWRGRHG